MKTIRVLAKLIVKDLTALWKFILDFITTDGLQACKKILFAFLTIIVGMIIIIPLSSVFIAYLFYRWVQAVSKHELDELDEDTL